MLFKIDLIYPCSSIGTLQPLFALQCDEPFVSCIYSCISIFTIYFYYPNMKKIRIFCLDDDFLLLGMRDIYLILVIFKAKIELNPEVNEFKTFFKPWFTCPQSLLKLLGFPICHCKNNTSNS